MLASEGIVGKNVQSDITTEKELKCPSPSNFEVNYYEDCVMKELPQSFIQAIRALHIPIEIFRNLFRVRARAGRIVEVAAGDHDRFALHHSPRALQMQCKFTYLFGIAAEIPDCMALSEVKPSQVRSASGSPQGHADEHGERLMDLIFQRSSLVTG